MIAHFAVYATLDLRPSQNRGAGREGNTVLRRTLLAGAGFIDLGLFIQFQHDAM